MWSFHHLINAEFVFIFRLVNRCFAFSDHLFLHELGELETFNADALLSYKGEMGAAYLEYLNNIPYNKFLEACDISNQITLTPVIRREDGGFSIDIELLERVTEYFRNRIRNLFKQN